MQKEFSTKLKADAPTSLSAFVEFMTPEEPPAEHHEWLCDKLEAIERRDLMRATVSMPPGHAKTKFCSRYFPAWYLGRNPLHRYLQGGHSQSFAENEFGKAVRGIIQDPRYAEVFPEVALNPRSTAAGNWQLDNRRGGYVTKGVGQSIAGYRGHCGGVDDPFGSREDAESPTLRQKVADWFFADFRTRFLPNSPIFIIATRWHPDDLIGRVEALNKEGKGIPWEIINLDGIIETEEEMMRDPMGRSLGEPLWKDFYTYDILMELKATLPQRDWWSLYKGRPRIAEGNVVKRTWFNRYKNLPRNFKDENGRFVRNIKKVVVSVDTANKTTRRSNHSVATVWIEDTANRHYLADVVRKKVEINELIPMVEDLAAKWSANEILVEDKGNGTTYIQLRRGRAPAPIIAIQPEDDGSKEFRFDATIPMWEGGEVLLPEEASWLGDYEEEILSFPSEQNDQIDSTSQYLNRARKRLKLGSKKLKGAGARAREAA